MKEKIRSAFETYRDEMLRDLAALVAIDSSGGDPKPDAPFGEGPAEALHTFLKIADRMGFETDNVDNYAGTVSLGSGEETVGILAHHAPMLCAVAKGVLRCTREDGSTVRVRVSDGVVYVVEVKKLADSNK